jgi:hypothetical protein
MHNRLERRLQAAESHLFHQQQGKWQKARRGKNLISGFMLRLEARAVNRIPIFTCKFMTYEVHALCNKSKL